LIGYLDEVVQRPIGDGLGVSLKVTTLFGTVFELGIQTKIFAEKLTHDTSISSVELDLVGFVDKYW
jgi:hypothetical protein